MEQDQRKEEEFSKILLHCYMVKLLIAEGWKDYELIDSGEGTKLERWGQYMTVRPEPRAIWEKSKPGLWSRAEAAFVQSEDRGDWSFKSTPPNPWRIAYDKIKFNLKPTDFRHVGVFPEQAVNWEWLKKSLTVAQLPNYPVKVLNLFAYTGGATIAAAASNAAVHVTHVDASRPAMMWASENTHLSGVAKEKIRWIQDDAVKFVNREIRRGVKYDGIIMDPPKFGRGVKGEVWKLLDDLPRLVDGCRQIMSDTPLFFLINAYAADMSSLVLFNLLSGVTKPWGGQVEAGELGLKETAGGRILPAGIFARWNRE